MTLPASKEEVSQAYTDPMRANIQEEFEDPLSATKGIFITGPILAITFWGSMYGLWQLVRWLM